MMCWMVGLIGSATSVVAADVTMRSSQSHRDDGVADPDLLELGGPWASLLVEPGPDDETPYLLTLRLRPEVPGGVVGRATEVREVHPDGLV